MILADRSIDIAADLDVVWQLVSSAEGLNQWMSAESEVELWAGGVIRWRHENNWVVAGEVVEVLANQRLVFTYGWEEGGFPIPAGSTEVTLSLVAIETGTRVRVQHRGLPPEMVQPHHDGWGMFLDDLADLVTTPNQHTPTHHTRPNTNEHQDQRI